MRRVTRLERLALGLTAIVVALGLVIVLELRESRFAAPAETAQASGRLVQLSEFVAAAAIVPKGLSTESVEGRAALETQLTRVAKAASAIATEGSFGSAISERFARLETVLTQRIVAIRRQVALSGEALDLSRHVWFALEVLNKEQEQLAQHGAQASSWSQLRKHSAAGLALALLGGLFFLLREIRAWVRRARQPDAAALLPSGERFAGRQSLISGIQRGVAGSLDKSRTVGLVYVRLTNLPMIRERLGVEFSDGAVTNLLEQLRSQLRRGDLMARLEGDVLVVMVADISSKTDLQSVASRVRRALEAEIDETDSVRLSVDLGTAMYPLDGYSSEELIESARLAMDKRSDEITAGASEPIYLATFRPKMS